MNDKNIILSDKGILKDENVIRFEIMLKHLKFVSIFCILFFTILFCNFELIKISIFISCILFFWFFSNIFDFEEKIINIFTEDIYLEKTIKEAQKYKIEDIDDFKKNIEKMCDFLWYRSHSLFFIKETINKTLNIFYSEEENYNNNNPLINELLVMLIIFEKLS